MEQNRSPNNTSEVKMMMTNFYQPEGALLDTPENKAAIASVQGLLQAQASGRVLEKVGMQKEGILRKAGRNNQGLFDLVFCAILRSDFL